MEITERPLVAVGGVDRLDKVAALTLYMHEGYDILPQSPEVYLSPALSPGWHLVDGNLENPLASWPVYALVA